MSKYWRTLWVGLVIGLCIVGCSVFGAANQQQANSAGSAVDPYIEPVQAGVQYLQKRAQEQLTLAENLLAALKSGDMDRAKQAYVAARAPYEEIEVLAASFPEEDEAIDARPYAIAGGETSENYISMHRIEALIYRDKNLAAAVPYGEKLITS
ncbi:MAG: EfeM/EfeO family lipoprotein, partial [Gloeomargarita sp. DG_2_bins_126]